MAGSAALILLVWGQVNLPGTQPNELVLPPEPSSTCGCHESFTAEQTEPGQSYRATLMALGAYDPLFRTSFLVAEQDLVANPQIEKITDLCIRCHAPVAWLSGRSEGSLDELIPEDMSGVSCDVCHRMIPTDPPLIGDGQMTIDTRTTKRSQRGAAPFGGHNVARSDYQGSAEMCAVCHSLFNPAEQGHGPNGAELSSVYYEQRTYEEWRDSKFGRDQSTCVSCHMDITMGAAVRGGDEYDDLRVHSFVGGNFFAIEAIDMLNPNLGIRGDLPEVERWIDASLASAAELEIISTPATSKSGESYELQVRLTNKTGHKLPTGYPEGRRVYLEVSLELPGAQPAILSGEWDPQSGNVIRDPQLRTYETEHGRVENGQSERTHSLILMNQVINDTRIPPEGFTPAADAPDMIPAGRDYGSSAPYRHWDNVTYTFTAPAVSNPTSGMLRVRALYQATDGEVVSFLLGRTGATAEGAALAAVWEALDHSPPRLMAELAVPVSFEPAPVVVDAGTSSADTGADVSGAVEGGGCSCHAGKTTEGSKTGLMMSAMLLLAGLRLRRREH